MSIDRDSVTAEIGTDWLNLTDVTGIARNSGPLRVAESCWDRVDAAREMVRQAIQRGEIIYGVTSGFGALSGRTISPELSRELQINLLRSHACGTGPELPDDTVRTMLALRAHALTLGYSGVRREVIELLIAMHNHDILPVVPAQGSVGASGDLAPLAHLALPLTGEGTVKARGHITDAATALQNANLTPLVLEPKEALALINGTQAMTAMGAIAWIEAGHVIDAAIDAGALTAAALAGRTTSFDDLIHRVRPHPGQRAVAARLRALLDGWSADPNAVRPMQDRYSLRAMPQVLGAIVDTHRFAGTTFETEINSATDNPLFFVDEDKILNGANFHGHPVALTCDHLKTAVASLTTYSERRTASLVNQPISGVPGFLSQEPGLHSGLMIAQYAAASLVSENRVLAHPASVDSLSTSADIEDYNSMGTLAARNLDTTIQNAARVVAIELICAAQSIDLGQVDLAQAPVAELHRRVREQMPFLERDQSGVGERIDAIAQLIRAGGLRDLGTVFEVQ